MPFLTGLLAIGTHLTDGILVFPPAAAGYAHQPIAIDLVLSGVGASNAPIIFGPCTADWGSMNYLALLDSAGNQVLAAPMAPVLITVAGNNRLQAAGGSIQLQLGPAWASDLVLNAAGQIVWLGSGEPART